MLIDFCNSGLVSEISSSTGECDGYSVSNLIKEKASVNQKGFLVDYFIKPPVTITLKFHCKILLNHIVLWPSVGAQKTVGLEIFTCYDKSEVVCPSVGIAYLKNNESGFLFYKRGDSNAKNYAASDFFLQPFKSTKYLKTECVKIRIMRTLGSSVPAMKRVEVWGIICDECPKSTKTMVLNTWSKIKNGENVLPNLARSSLENKSDKTTEAVKLTNRYDLQIPEEFIDPITFELMVLPMTLPCGKIIDNSTLEKFVKEEEKWGRSPSDPFTGKMFTQINKPKVCASLKVRIDKFLIDHSNEKTLQTIPRIVGGTSTGPRISCLISNVICTRSTSTEQVKEETCVGKDMNLGKRKIVQRDTSLNPQLKCLKIEKVNKNLVNKLPKKPQTTKTFSELKEESLNNTLQQTLSNLPSFQSRTVLSEPDVSCSKCEVSSSLYELPCNHYLCRICLSSAVFSKTLKCLKCYTPFSSNDPHRVHNL